MVLQAKEVIHSRDDVLRPIIHRLNNDNTWLLQIPRAKGPRLFYNILIDPWLAGPDVNFHRYVHEQHHGEESAAKSIAEVEEFLKDIEELARTYRTDVADSKDAPPPLCWVDVVSISIYGGDHCNEATLKQVPSSVPVFAYDPAAQKQIKGWKHFETVVQTPKFNGNWKDVHRPPLPDDISISMVQNWNDFVNLHFGLVVAFQTPSSDGVRGTSGDEAECIYHTPHGTPAAHLASLAAADPPLKVLALLHGLLKVEVGWSPVSFTANLGAHNGLEVSRQLKSKYWLQTHDEKKVEKGLTSLILDHDWQKVEDAAAACAETTGEDKAEILKKANFWDIGNGGSLVLA